MRRHMLFTHSLSELPGHALHHAPCVGKHQRGVMRINERRQLVIHVLPHFIGHHRFQRSIGQQHLDIALTYMTGVHYHAVLTCQCCIWRCAFILHIMKQIRRRIYAYAHQKIRNFLNRLLRS